MPRATKKPCYHPGCPELTFTTYCEKHEKKNSGQYNKNRPDRHDLYDSQWAKASKLFLAKNPLCEECLKYNVLRPSKETDHIIPHNGNYKLFWNSDNWQALCKTCHSQKTNKERS